MRTLILGGGLSGLSLAYFLKGTSLILEKEAQLGGLCRSYSLNQVIHDIGPHALFSKNESMLSWLTSLIKTAVLRRSNKILHAGKLIKYPFENDLASLDEDERQYCLEEFLNNPYARYPAKNMLQFFLKTFGEGITRLYLQPYNEKIWKFDPSCMDTQMVQRIPSPPRQDVIDSAHGRETEGYLHQLHFHYPYQGGMQNLIDTLAAVTAEKTQIVHPAAIKSISRADGTWVIDTDRGSFTGDPLISCMPLHELMQHIEAPRAVINALNRLRYNSIHIVALQATDDALGSHFSFYIADKKILFHRVSKVDFLGDAYRPNNGCATLLAECTFRPESYLGSLDPEDIKRRVLDDLEQLNIVRKRNVVDCTVRSFKYAYVIYDLHHRKHADCVLKHLADLGIRCCGRFAEFEYLNMDAVFEHSYGLAQTLNGMAHEQ